METKLSTRSEFADHLFTRAISLPTSARGAFLEAYLGSNPTAAAQAQTMLRQFDRLSGFLESPLQLSSPEPLFAAGGKIGGRFHIDRFIARGGMGEVYAAHDRILDEPVALKTIGAFEGSEEWLRERFRDEIRLGRRVSHRNICRIYDIYEHSLEDGRTVLLFAMELLEGETLAAMMAREGPLSLSVARSILAQVLAGIGEAHATGIVHRDFKPANVILTATRAVITDFGLAQLRLDPALMASQQPGVLAGSLPYMAPEQFVDSNVGAAADLFSVGVTMYEMITGETPFPSEPVSKALEARLSSTYRPPGAWRKPIAHCLSPDPDRRPKNVQEVLREIGGGIRRRAMISGSVAAAACAAYGVWRVRLPMDIAAGMPVLLIDAVDERTNRGSPVVDQLLRLQLNQSAHFEVIGKDRIALALERMGKPSVRLPSDHRIAREVALREGSPLLISPSVVSSPELALRIEIEKLGSHPYFALGSWSRAFPARSESDLRTAASEAALWIRQSIGEHAGDIARRDRRPEEATTSSWEGLLEYVQAENARLRGDDAEAIRRLRQALAIDGEFPLAHMRLAEFLLGLGRADDGYAHWRRAAYLIEQRHLTDRESFRIRALFLHDMRDFAGAETIIGNWAAEFPNDYMPYFYLASCQRVLGRPAEALESLNTAYSKSPGNPHVVLNRAQLHMEQDRPHSAKTDLDSVREVNVWWWQYLAEYYFVISAYRQTWNCIDHLATLAPEWRSKSFSLRACLLFETGQNRDAMRLLHLGIAYDRSLQRLAPNLPGKLLLLSAGALRTGDPSTAGRAANEAAEEGKESITRLRAAALLWEAGDRKAAKQMAARTLDTPDYPVYKALRCCYEGEIVGVPARAATLFGQARSAFPAGDISTKWARALEREGNTAAARDIWLETARYPARYWLEPYRQAPAVFRDSLLATASFDTTAARTLQSLTSAGRELAVLSARS